MRWRLCQLQSQGRAIYVAYEGKLKIPLIDLTPFYQSKSDKTVAQISAACARPGGTGIYPPIAYKDYAKIRFQQSHGTDKSLDLS